MSEKRLLATFWMCLITTESCINRNHAFRADSRNVVGRYVCEKDVMDLKCNSATVLEIRTTSYGGSSAFICGNGEKSNGTCKEDKTNLVKKRCDNRPACSIPAIRQIFGDPCPGLTKYLNIIYACVSPLKTRKSTTITPTQQTTHEEQPETSTAIYTTAETNVPLEANTNTVQPNTTSTFTQQVSTGSPEQTTRDPTERTILLTEKEVVTRKPIPTFNPANSVEIEALLESGTPTLFPSVRCFTWAGLTSVVWIWGF